MITQDKQHHNYPPECSSVLTNNCHWNCFLQPGRHSHTLCQYHDALLLFGGEISRGILTNDLWLFNTTTRNWSLLAVNDSSAPPPVAGHTANVVEDKMFVYGGKGTVGLGGVLSVLRCPFMSQLLTSSPVVK